MNLFNSNKKQRTHLMLIHFSKISPILFVFLVLALMIKYYERQCSSQLNLIAMMLLKCLFSFFVSPFFKDPARQTRMSNLAGPIFVKKGPTCHIISQHPKALHHRSSLHLCRSFLSCIDLIALD